MVSSFCHLFCFIFTFPKQLGMEGKVDGSVHGGVRVASFEGAAAELGLETQLSSRAAFLWCNCGDWVTLSLGLERNLWKPKKWAEGKLMHICMTRWKKWGFSSLFLVLLGPLVESIPGLRGPLPGLWVHPWFTTNIQGAHSTHELYSKCPDMRVEPRQATMFSWTVIK